MDAVALNAEHAATNDGCPSVAQESGAWEKTVDPVVLAEASDENEQYRDQDHGSLKNEGEASLPGHEISQEVTANLNAVKVDVIEAIDTNTNNTNSNDESDNQSIENLKTEASNNNNNNNNNNDLPVTNENVKATAPVSWATLFKSTNGSDNSSQSNQSKPAVGNNQEKKNGTASKKMNNVDHLNGNSGNNNNNNNNRKNSSSVQDVADTSNREVLKTLGNMLKMCELKHSAPALQPRGIRNKQNWCYINAVSKRKKKILIHGYCIGKINDTDLFLKNLREKMFIYSILYLLRFTK